MAYSEEIKLGLRHNQAEPENYIWVTHEKAVYKAPVAEINSALNSEQKFLAAKTLFENGNPDVYMIELNQ